MVEPKTKMTQEEFRQKRQEINEEGDTRKGEAAAYKEQEVSRLFDVCGWPQEEIAKEVGMSQRWVSYRLVFGRFLSFSTNCAKTQKGIKNMTEGGFRDMWKVTKGTEPERFALVLKSLDRSKEEVQTEKEMEAKMRTDVPNFVRACLADGEVWSTSRLAEKIREKFPNTVNIRPSNSFRYPEKWLKSDQILKTGREGKEGTWQIRPAAEGFKLPHTTAIDEAKKLFDGADKSLEKMGRGKQYDIQPADLLRIREEYREAMRLITTATN